MLYLIKLIFKKSLSIGDGNSWDDNLHRGIIHSDMLFSGIINQWVKIQGAFNVDELVLRLNSDSPPFKISSAYPFFGSYFYLPTPIGLTMGYSDISKELPFLELYDFLKLANGEKKHISKIPLKNPLDEFLIGNVSPRVTIDRLSTASNIYETRGWATEKGGGFYFLLELSDEPLRNTIELCVHMLGEAGIGSDRSVGYGTFDMEMDAVGEDSYWSELFQDREKRNKIYYTLSLCHPSDLLEEPKNVLSYNLLIRGGWIISNSSMFQMKRKECKMFSEGSIFKTPIKGKVADVTPSGFISEHKVYRYGLGMMIGVINDERLF